MKKNIEVVAAIFRKQDKYFCAQRKDQGELAKKWEFPGGKIEPGETHAEALVREIKEELNTDIFVKDFLMTVHHEYNGFILTMHSYMCEIVNGTLEISEHLDSKWENIEKMKKMDFAMADIPIINELESKFIK